MPLAKNNACIWLLCLFVVGTGSGRRHEANTIIGLCLAREEEEVGAGRLVLVGEDVDRTLSKNQHILNIVPTSPQHPPHPHVLSTRIPRT